LVIFIEDLTKSIASTVTDDKSVPPWEQIFVWRPELGRSIL